jgi:phosphoribosylglycinamide formyltransferase 2
LVTLGSQALSEFALHARAILGLPIPGVPLLRAAHSVALLGHLDGVPVIEGVAEALAVPESQVRLFGKPECRGHRRLGVAIATGANGQEAAQRARAAAACIRISASAD